MRAKMRAPPAYVENGARAADTITGIVRRVAANHRHKVARNVEDGSADIEEVAQPYGLDPESAAMLRALDQSVPDPERREAFVLHYFFEHTIAEIAVITGASEHTVERRITMANKDLRRDDDETPRDKKRRAGAFLGFGTLEAMVAAWRPKPVPPEVGERLWQRLAPRMGPAAPPPTNPPPASPGGVVLAKGVMAGLLVGALVVGPATGVGGVLAWQTWRPTREVCAVVEAPARAPVAPALVDFGAEPAGVVASVPTSAPMPSTSSATRAAPPRRLASARPVTAPDPGSSRRLLLRIRSAAEAAENADGWKLVLELVEAHAQKFPGLDAVDRDTERALALRQLRQPETR